MDRSPYKFLAPYGIADSDLFVGREHEVETLLGDIISSRLVVLFARTGTGKTSLINAGVRPRLEALDYRTLHLRVESDPLLVVRRALDEAGLVTPADADSTVPDQLRQASRQLEKPIVLFFDQFEKFFIRFRNGSQGRTAPVGKFVTVIAELYRDRDSGIHTVFSMREEYFVELEAFRDEIPSIFQNESTLRLRPLLRAQAERAITEPAAILGVPIDEGLSERIVSDLEHDGFVNPPELQIVCDTLWRASGGKRLSLADYEMLGGAAELFRRRLEEEISQLPEPQLALLDPLVPALRTSDGTKYMRGVDELRESLRADEKAFRDLVTAMKAAHLLNELQIGRATYVEWVSDFLAARSEDIRTSARLTLHRRTLQKAAMRSQKPDPLSSRLAALVFPIPREQFASISEDLKLLRVDGEVARRGLVTALARGVPARGWLEVAARTGVDIRGLLRALIVDPDFPEAGAATLRLLAELRDDPVAVPLLEEALAEPRLRMTALDSLTQLETAEATDALRRAVGGAPAAAAEAIDALRRMGTPAAITALTDIVGHDDAFALRAASALNAVATEPEILGRAPTAREAFTGVLDKHSGRLLRIALREGVQARVWFERAREHGVAVWTLLREEVSNPIDVEEGNRAVALLRELPDEQAGELLELALAQPSLGRVAADALGHRGREPLMAPQQPAPSPRVRVPAFERGGIQWNLLLRRIKAGRCLPILGPGLAYPRLPLSSQIAEKWESELDLPRWGNTKSLARVAQWFSAATDPMYVKESFAQEVSALSARDVAMADDSYAMLAKLPFQLYLTKGFDDFLEQALRSFNRDVISDICSWNSAAPMRALHHYDYGVSTDRPLVLHLYGRLDIPESLVLSEDDHVQFLTATLTQEDIVAPEVKSAIASHMRLVLGESAEALVAPSSLQGLLNWGSPELRRSGLMVLLEPEDETIVPYLQRRADRDGIQIFWGTVDQFIAELSARWEAGLPE